TRNVFQDHLHSLFRSMNDLTPQSTHCRELMSRSTKLQRNESGDLERLQLVVSKLYAFGEVADIRYLQCTCPMAKVGVNGSVSVGQSSLPNSCILYFYQSFLQSSGFADLVQFTYSQVDECVRTAIRGIWQCHQIKHLINKC